MTFLDFDHSKYGHLGENVNIFVHKLKLVSLTASKYKSAKYQSNLVRNNNFMQYLIQLPSGIKYEKIAGLYSPRYILTIICSL